MITDEKKAGCKINKKRNSKIEKLRESTKTRIE